MHTGDFRVSRGVMLVEVVGALGLQSVMWFDFVFDRQWGVVRLVTAIIEKHFHVVATDDFFFRHVLTEPGSSYFLIMMFVNSVIGLLCPAGLFFGLRYVLSGRGIENRILGWTLATVPVILNLIGTIAGEMWGPSDYQVPLLFAFLFVWLPAAVVVHLTWLGRLVQPDLGGTARA